jgi:hypothetical protein
MAAHEQRAGSPNDKIDVEAMRDGQLRCSPWCDVGGPDDDMKLYVCWGTFPVPWPRRDDSWRPGAHACKRAHDALTEAGHAPKVIKTYSFGQLPDLTRGRREVRRLTGESWVPVLVLDDGEVIAGSREIAAWARGHPAAATSDR